MNVIYGHNRGTIGAQQPLSVGYSKTRTFRIWMGMKQRCYNSNNKDFHYYGGRGIKVCDRWLNSFENFYVDMGECPKGLCIDRIETNSGYKPENCRWTNMTVQANNRNARTQPNYDFYGDSLTIPQWAKMLNIPKKTVYRRIRDGWSIKEAIFALPGRRFGSTIPILPPDERQP